MDDKTQAGTPRIKPLLTEIEPVESVKAQPKAEAMNNTARTDGGGGGGTRAE